MKRFNEPPALVELVEASRDRHVRALLAHDVLLGVLLGGVDSDLAPKGCFRRVDGDLCSPLQWHHICATCGQLIHCCARHGGDREAQRELDRHAYRVHGEDDGADE